MDTFIFIGRLILIFIGIPVGLGFFIYFIPKRLGYPNTAKYLTIAYTLLVLSIVLFIKFEDRFFTRNNAKKLVEEQGIELLDDFELIRNESMSAIGDYYRTFTLKISDRDKQDAILEIKNDSNFKSVNSSIEFMLYQSDDRYFGPKVTRNYEDQNTYVRECFEPSGQEGYAPSFKRISISKLKNELIFTEIVE